MLSDKKILLAVSGSIAAYKAAFFVRLLVKEGAQVKVIMTKSATDFITPLTLATLSNNPVEVDFFDQKDGSWSNHVELGLWADLMIVAPASANTIGKMANGICDNLLIATYLSARCPVMIAPAMDLDMYQHASTQDNLAKLQKYGNHIISPAEGELASGLSGKGRMQEPERLIESVSDHFKKKTKLSGKKVLITSGPTHEPIDPVRFIGNHSTGKMGAALAKAAADLGAEVTFVSGPVNQYPQHDLIHTTPVQSASEMLDKVQLNHKASDIVIFAAAVADYRVATIAPTKMKRNGQELNLELTENPDIASTLGREKRNNQIHVGFALETNDGEKYAKQKLAKKNFDFIILNMPSDKGTGFGHDTNQVTMYDRNNIVWKSELITKDEIARHIMDILSQ